MTTKSRIRTRKSIKSRSEYLTLLVITNGKETELSYFRHINRLFKETIKTVFNNDDVDGLVNQANREATKYDRIYIVIDIDARLCTEANRINLEKAIKSVKGSNIEFILSNESFDIWILAHSGHKVPKAAKDRNTAKELASRNELLLGKNKKHVEMCKVTRETITKAIEEAKRLHKNYDGPIGVIDSKGPTTDVDKIIDKLQWRD